MARKWISDFLSVNPFWLADVGPTNPLSLPILSPLSGFSAITAPELNIETESIQEGNWPIARKVVKSASLSSITLSRGATFYDSDFLGWVNAALYGDTALFESPIPGLSIGGPTYRRNLMLVHFFSRMLVGRTDPAFPAVGGLSQTALFAAANSAANPGGAREVFGGISFGLGVATLAQGLAAAGVAPFEFAARIPARLFILHNCIPKRYKPGSDFEAVGNDISIQELEIEMEGFEQVSIV